MARARQYPPSVDPGAPNELPTPEGWQRFTFGELLDVVERPVILDDDREYQLVNAKRSRGGIAPRERLRGRDIKVKSQFRIETNDFLVSKRQIIHGACGVVHKELNEAIVSNEYAVLHPKPSLNIDYLKHLSFTTYFQRTCFHSSVGVDVEKMVFKLDQWFRYSVSIPPPSEQRKIVTILSSADKSIEQTQAVIDQLEVAKAATLAALFIERSIEVRLRVSGTKQWASDPVLSLFDRPERSQVPRLQSTGYKPEGKYPIVDQGQTFIVGRTNDEAVLYKGTLPVIIFGDHTRIWKYVDFPFVVGADGTQLLIPRQDLIDPQFAFYAASALPLKDLGYSRHFKLLKEASIEHPDKSGQQRVSALLRSFDEAIEANRKKLAQLSIVKAGLVEDLLSGRTRVSCANLEAA